MMADIKYFSSPVHTLSAHNTIHDALTIMKVNFVKRVVIVKDRKPIGIITERDVGRFLEKDRTNRALDEVPLREVMKKDLITIEANQTEHFEQCAARMITFKIGSIVITDDDGNLAGITTQTDITAAFAFAHAGKYRVRDYMSEKVVTCRDSDLLQYVLEIMNKNDVSRLAVTDHSGTLKGIITTNTFLKHSEYFKSEIRGRDYLLPSRADRITAGDLLVEEILTVTPDEDLASAASLMIRNSISGIPVVTDRMRLVGIISKFDVVRAYSNIVPHNEILQRYRTFP
jgi:CBS domain-containing protein